MTGTGYVQDAVIEELQAAIEALKRELPGESFYEVHLGFSAGERAEECAGGKKSWAELSWSIQVSNETAAGDSLEEAIRKLQQERRVQAAIPGWAARVADILRELPDDAYARHRVLGDAQIILDKERRAGSV
jgi:hypothetical protein